MIIEFIICTNTNIVEINIVIDITKSFPTKISVVNVHVDQVKAKKWVISMLSGSWIPPTKRLVEHPPYIGAHTYTHIYINFFNKTILKCLLYF